MYLGETLAISNWLNKFQETELHHLASIEYDYCALLLQIELN